MGLPVTGVYVPSEGAVHLCIVGVSKGGIEVTGISAKRALVTSEIGEFSDKKVTFA